MRAGVVVVCSLTLFACKGGGPKPDIVKQDSAQTSAGAAASAEAGASPSEPASGDRKPPARMSCAQAMAAAERLDRLGEQAEIDPLTVEQLVRGQPLEWLAATDLALGRMSRDQPQDVDLVVQVLATLAERDLEGMRSDLVLIATQLRAVGFLEMRRQLGEVADDRLQGDAAVEAWTAARCLWEAGLRSLAKRADALPERGGEAWEAWIDEAFADGEAAIRTADAAQIKAAKQRIEKALYAVFQRLIVAAAEAHTRPASSEALGLLDALDDRLADRNGPGLRRMRMQFNGDPAALDPAAIERDIAVAFSKRARKYCDKAVVNNELATPAAIGESWEGLVYTRVILPDMRARLGAQGFDADAYLADWDSYLEAIESGDATTAAEVSPRLVEWNCAYQSALGIAECTASTDEPEP